MGSPIDVATRKPLLSAAAKPAEPLNVVCQPTKKLGSSNCINLHARFVVKTYANGESISYAAALTEKQKDERLAQNESSEINGGIAESDTNKDSKPTIEKYSSTRGEHHQNGLTSYAKRCMRILGNQYQEDIDHTDSTAQSCTFTTLSFRRIIPSSDKDGKDIFRAYLERIRRSQGNIKYVWVAEKQEGKTIKGVESYRKKHGQSVIHFHLLSPEQFGHEWVNTAWNETVANHFLKWEQINDLDHQKWMDELIMHNRYCKRLAKWRNGERTTRPKPPAKTEFLLTPNVITVYDASRYMSKYISKEQGKISGHLWGMDAASKRICKPNVREIYFNDEYDVNRFAKRLHNLIAATGEEMKSEAAVFTWDDYNNYVGLWCSDKALFAGCYSQLLQPT